MNRVGRRFLIIATVVTLALVLAYRPLLSPRTGWLWGYERHRAELMTLLHSERPDERKRGAWDMADRPDPRALQYVCGRLYGDESSADVREAYVYALGHAGDAGAIAAVRYVIEHDPSAYVRGTAWLAAARLDAVMFAELQRERAAARDAAERLGLAQGRAALGDPDSVAELLALAADRDESVRVAASRAATKIVATALDALGCWPVDEPRDPLAVWPVERVARVRAVVQARSCPAFNAALGVELRLAARHQVRPEAFRSLLGRIGGARERIAHWLGGP